MHNFTIEGGAPSNANRKADVLLEYQRLLKKYGLCSRKTFQNCLRKATEYVPLQDRCELPISFCNPYAK